MHSGSLILDNEGLSPDMKKKSPISTRFTWPGGGVGSPLLLRKKFWRGDRTING